MQNFSVILSLLTCAFLLVIVEVCGKLDNSVFGFGAEDNNDNDFFRLPFKSTHAKIEPGTRKTTRQEKEDVEWFLNPGPMMAPEIILKQFVDSRVSLTNFHHNTNEMLQNGTLPESSMNMSMHWSMSDDMSSQELIYNDMLENAIMKGFNQENEIEDALTGKSKCNKKFTGSTGSFTLGFNADCLIHIVNPEKSSRLILSCSPVPLGNCSTNKDAVAINLLGDTSFKQNSFLYCGEDAIVRAISLRNELAIRIKGFTDNAAEKSVCTFQSRQQRGINIITSPTRCGHLGRVGKIVGGRSVPPGLFPWAVQLDITRMDGSQTGCTGTIVSPYYILTAAHCMKRAESVSAFMGGTDRLDIIGSEVLIQAEKYILHKKWSPRTLVADIALVKLTEPVQYSEDISPICLPEGKLLTEDMSGKRGVAIGWGRTETKKKAPRRLFRVKLPLLSDNSCRNIYRRFFIPKMMMCTDSKKDSAICYGIMKLYNFLSLKIDEHVFR